MAWLNSLDDHPITNQVTSFSTNISKLIVSHDPQKSLQKVCIFCETLATPTKILECAHFGDGNATYQYAILLFVHTQT